MASAHSRSDTRGRPPPKRWVFTCSGSNGSNTAHNSSEMRNPVVVRLFGVRSRSRFLVACLFITPIFPRFSGYSDRHLLPWRLKAGQISRSSRTGRGIKILVQRDGIKSEEIISIRMLSISSGLNDYVLDGEQHRGESRGGSYDSILPSWAEG